MRASFTDRLRCPRCRRDGRLVLEVGERDAREVRTGTLTCPACGHAAAVRDGIADLLHDPPGFVVREAAGLTRFAQVMADQGWDRDRVMALPGIEDGYWFHQRVMLDQTLAEVPFAPGESILDVGSNTCWATAAFARHGLDATALDITEQPMQGLRTAEWQFEDKGVYFERVLGLMFALPFADGAFDNVWACEVLHHNHRANLVATLREIHRVLRPGGRLIVANETLRALLAPQLSPGRDVAQFEGHEHAYLRCSYTRAARRAGFEVDVRGPHFHDAFRPAGARISERTRLPPGVREVIGMVLRRSRRLRHAVLAVHAYVLGDTALHMVCTKPLSPAPARPRARARSPRAAARGRARG